MRRMQKVFFMALMIALFFLGSRALIKGPDTGSTEMSRTARPPALCALNGPEEAQNAARVDRPAPKSEAAVPFVNSPKAFPAPEADGNGMVLRGERWYRAAWCACPPEAAFG